MSVDIWKSTDLKLSGVNQKSHLKMPEEKNTIPNGGLIVNFDTIIFWEMGGWRRGPTRKEKKKEWRQGEGSRLKTGHSLLK